uniref:Heme O synthase n=1 Tax=Ditylenchus dipsaci TaxID=166011 RepID=A0A915EKJ6_9BILA
MIVSYSLNGSLSVTGGEDGKVKIWSYQNSFCIVTFTEHSSGVSDVCFTQNGKVILSASLGGSVRAHDIKRYRNFRTLVSLLEFLMLIRGFSKFLVAPKQTQLNCLCSDSSVGFLMLLVAKVAVGCCRHHVHKKIFIGSKQIVRQASALPKARPNKDEAVKIEVEVSKKVLTRRRIISLLLQCFRHQLRDFPQLMMKCLSKSCEGGNSRYLEENGSGQSSWRIFTALQTSLNNADNCINCLWLSDFRCSVLMEFLWSLCSWFSLFGLQFADSWLGLLNLLLYAGVYTPMKRYHIGCTWVGAINGAIPPLMGYTAATGTVDLAALTLGAILFSWQFPHFNALSWNLRGDYSRAGYRVMCVTNEELCRRTTLRHSVAVLALCSVVAPVTNLTTYVFALDSLPLNLVMVYLSYKFYRRPDGAMPRLCFATVFFIYLF